MNPAQLWRENREMLEAIGRSLSRILSPALAPLRALALERAVELAVIAAILINACAYVSLSGNLRNSAGRYLTACDDREELSNGEYSLFTRETYYPPLHYAWMAICPWATRPISPPWLLLWSNLLMVAGIAGVSSALKRLGTRREARWIAALLMAGFPLSVGFSCTLHTETALVGCAGVLLWCLATPGELPSRRRAAAAGAVLGVAALIKWTFVLAAAGPVAIWAIAMMRHANFRQWLVRILWVVITAAAISAWWYACILDWERLRATVENDPVIHGIEGWERHRAAYWLFALQVRRSLGDFLGALAFAGAGLALWRRLPGAATAASSALLPMLFLPTLPHFEERYLLMCLPGLAMAAGLGLGSLARRRSSLVAVFVTAAACWQVVHTTWSGAFQPQQPGHPGPIGSYNHDFTMGWTRWKTIEHLRSRVFFWWKQLEIDRKAALYAIHPLEAHPDLRSELLHYLERKDSRHPQAPLLAGYDFSTYLTFVRQLEAGEFDFLVLSEETLAAPAEALEFVLENAWSWVPLSGAYVPQPPGAPPEQDPLLLEKINKAFGVVETFHDGDRPIYILVRRDLEGAKKRKWVLCPLPSREAMMR